MWCRRSHVILPSTLAGQHLYLGVRAQGGRERYRACMYPITQLRVTLRFSDSEAQSPACLKFCLVSLPPEKSEPGALVCRTPQDLTCQRPLPAFPAAESSSFLPGGPYTGRGVPGPLLPTPFPQLLITAQISAPASPVQVGLPGPDRKQARASPSPPTILRHLTLFLLFLPHPLAGNHCLGSLPGCQLHEGTDCVRFVQYCLDKRLAHKKS